MISRRQIIGTLFAGTALAWPVAAFAQTTDRVRRIGFLSVLDAADPEQQSRTVAFTEGLANAGWQDGRNIRIDYRFAGADPDRIRAYAGELVAAASDVILAATTPSVAALRQATRSVPIVFVGVTDPVGQGFVASLAHPGGNVTGFTYFEPAMAGKWLEMVKEMAPQVARVALLFNPETAPYFDVYLRSFEAAAQSFPLQLIAAPVRDDAEIERAVAAFGRESNGGLIVVPDAFTSVHREWIVALAARHRLPAVYPFRSFAASGGLMSYGFDPVDLYRRAAAYVDRILKGAKPGELPVQAPTKFELVINLKTAKALGLTIPQSILVRADEVIE